MHKIDHNMLNTIPRELLQCLNELSGVAKKRIYFSGGPVRDWYLGRVPVDYDLTVADGGIDLGRQLAGMLRATLVVLSEEEAICRVVAKELVVDISTFRNKARTIEEDLYHRDFTINALAIDCSWDVVHSATFGEIIDPLGGVADLDDGVIQVCNPLSLADDPLRLLRAFRFSGQLGFAIDPQTIALIQHESAAISGVAGERIWSELKKILQSFNAWELCKCMDSCGLLCEILPELSAGRGLGQPSSHHLDVFDHCLETLKQMERILEAPAQWFPEDGQVIDQYCREPETVLLLKVAALLHDIGKPLVHGHKECGRITFYNHDGEGERLIAGISRRLKWSGAETHRVSRWVKQHMWPFHLNNGRRKTGITPRACLKLAKASGSGLIGLFLLAMADSLAGQGEGKPAGIEREVASLFSEVHRIFNAKVMPVLGVLPINGRHLIEVLSLTPGPIFGEIFAALEDEMVTNGRLDKNSAIRWVRSYLDLRKKKKLTPAESTCRLINEGFSPDHPLT